MCMWCIIFPFLILLPIMEKNKAYLRIVQGFKEVSCWVSEWNTKKAVKSFAFKLKYFDGNLKICSNSNTIVSDKHTHYKSSSYCTSAKVQWENETRHLKLKSVTWRKMRLPREMVYNVESDKRVASTLPQGGIWISMNNWLLSSQHLHQLPHIHWKLTLPPKKKNDNPPYAKNTSPVHLLRKIFKNKLSINQPMYNELPRKHVHNKWYR